MIILHLRSNIYSNMYNTNKKHQITEDVYDELIAKKSRGEDISGNVIQNLQF